MERGGGEAAGNREREVARGPVREGENANVWVDLQETTFGVVAAAIFSYSSFSPPHTSTSVQGCRFDSLTVAIAC
ncbi:hypothetical protein QL285_033352 [Trifolium repens]|nr:hypothetical protein QL285_033352 [Trifolium repens]